MSSHNAMSPNQREALTAVSSITGKNEYVLSTNGAIDINGTIGGSPLPISGATTGVGVAILDSSGNQITSFGGGTQYTTGSAQATPTGTVSLGWDGTDVKALPLDGSGFLKVNVAAGGGSGGTSSSFSSAFPATGTAIGATDGTNMQPLKVDGSDNLLVKVNAALPAGTNVIGHTITDSGSVTAATQSGTWNITNISGTVSLPTGAATAANQTNASQKTQIVDGSGNVIASTSNALDVNSINSDLVDSGNSSTATLTSGSTFTGTGTSTVGFSYIEIYVYSDHDSASNGVKIEFSSDNSNWDDASTFTFTAGGSSPNDGQTYGAAARSKFYRVVYTNGGTNQTAFRLQSVLRTVPTIGDMVTMSTVPNSTNHATLTKSSIVGLTTAGGGAFVDVKVNPSGTLTVDASNSTGLAATVSQSTAANLNATVVGTGTFATQAAQSGTWNITNISGTVSLPTGAATAAKQPALGTAGTASSDVITVQGIASMTALKVDGSATTQPVSGTVTANAGTGTFNIQSNASVNLAQVGGASTATGHGTASGSLRVELPTDGTGVVGLNAGSNLVGKVGIDQTTNGTTNAVVTVPATSGGLSYTSASVGATATAIKASAGQLYGYHLFNTTAAVAYVQIFNVASGSVTVGTTTPDLSIGIPASGGVTVNFDKGIAFSTAISFACTTTRTGSSGATCDVNFFYK